MNRPGVRASAHHPLRRGLARYLRRGLARYLAGQQGHRASCPGAIVQPPDSLEFQRVAWAVLCGVACAIAAAMLGGLVEMVLHGWAWWVGARP